jgi:hypothetical protein
VAKLIRVAALPTEFNENEGGDLRDVLRRHDGERLVRQVVEVAEAISDGQGRADDIHAGVSDEVESKERGDLALTVSPSGKKPQRLIVAHCTHAFLERCSLRLGSAPVIYRPFASRERRATFQAEKRGPVTSFA